MSPDSNNTACMPNAELLQNRVLLVLGCWFGVTFTTRQSCFPCTVQHTSGFPLHMLLMLVAHEGDVKLQYRGQDAVFSRL